MKNKQVTGNKVSKSMLHMADAFASVVNKWNAYATQAEQNAAQLAERTSNKEERHLRGVLKHIAKYGKNSALHTFPVKSFTDHKTVYDVKQMLLGFWTCSCPDFTYTPLEDKADGYICKHIDYVQSTPKYAMDIAYGQGAIEAHRRLTDLAHNALGTEPVINFPAPPVKEEKMVKIQFQYSDGTWIDCVGDFEESFAKNFVRTRSTYRIKPEEYYKIQVELFTGWRDSLELTGSYTSEEADNAIASKKNGLTYRKVVV